MFTRNLIRAKTSVAFLWGKDKRRKALIFAFFATTPREESTVDPHRSIQTLR